MSLRPARRTFSRPMSRLTCCPRWKAGFGTASRGTERSAKKLYKNSRTGSLGQFPPPPFLRGGRPPANRQSTIKNQQFSSVVRNFSSLPGVCFFRHACREEYPIDVSIAGGRASTPGINMTPLIDNLLALINIILVLDTG